MILQEIWNRITTSPHTRVLEAQLARERADNGRLRAENRALLNSILGIAGIPPLPASLDGLTSAQNQIAMPPPAARAVIHPSSTPHVAAPMRRRSWPQINRLLEFESAQKEKPATEPLPPARV